MEDGFRHQGLRKKLRKFIENKGITDVNVLEAIETVPRHLFLDSAFSDLAYEDQALPIGNGQTISQPYTVAFQTQLLEVKSGDKVLEIGTGSGYQGCILAQMGVDLYSIERINALTERASAMFHRFNYRVHLFVGDGSLGLEKYAPFDKIIVTAASPDILQQLVNQLKVGGILVIPVGNKEVQTMVRIRKTTKTTYQSETFENFRFVPLIGKDGFLGQ